MINNYWSITYSDKIYIPCGAVAIISSNFDPFGQRTSEKLTKRIEVLGTRMKLSLCLFPTLPLFFFRFFCSISQFLC